MSNVLSIKKSIFALALLSLTGAAYAAGNASTLPGFSDTCDVNGVCTGQTVAGGEPLVRSPLPACSPAGGKAIGGMPKIDDLTPAGGGNGGGINEKFIPADEADKA